MKTRIGLSLIISLVFCHGYVYAHLPQHIDFKMTDLIKGVDNKEYLRACLIENGFKFSHKQLPSDNNGATFEEWTVSHTYENNPKISLHEIRVGLTNDPSFTYEEDVSISEALDTYRTYAEQLLSEAKKLFPIKTSLEVTDKDGPRYLLEYSRKTDNITVSFSTSDNWYDFYIYRKE